MTVLVVGIGNCTRGDDAVGPEVASRIEKLGLPDVEVVVHDEPLALVEHLACREEVVVVDATAAGGEPGRVHVVSVGPGSLQQYSPALGSHGLGVAEAVELARALGYLPRRLALVGVEGRDFTVGASLSKEVRARLDEAVRSVLELLPTVEPRPAVTRRRGSRGAAAAGRRP